MTYRSTLRKGDSLYDALTADDTFLGYDLLPISLKFAERYLRNVRAVEALVRAHFRLDKEDDESKRTTPGNISSECEKLRT